MASSGRYGRGGRGGRRGRGGGGYQRGGFRGGRIMRDRDAHMPPPAEDIDSAELKIEEKVILIELKKNEQGQFFKIVETDDQRHRGKVIFSVETGQTFRPILKELIDKYKEQGPVDEEASSERIHSVSFTQGRRRFYADLRQNSRGYFMKLTQVSNTQKVFVAIPGEGLSQFQEKFESLLDSYPPPAVNDNSPPMSPTGPPLPRSQEIKAGGKSFFFDVERNDRGVYLRLAEVVRTGRKSHINVPNSCWSKMAEILTNLHHELPSTESASGSGSEDN